MFNGQLTQWGNASVDQVATIEGQKNGKDNLSWLVDFAFILTFASPETRFVLGRVLGSVGLSSVYTIVAAILMVCPVFVYALLARRLVFRRTLIVFIVVLILFLSTLVIHPDYLEWYTRDPYGVRFFLYAPDRGALWMFFVVEACGSFARIWRNVQIGTVVLIPYYVYMAYRAHLEQGWWGFNADGDLIQRSYDLDFGYGMGLIILVAVVAFFQKTNHRWVNLFWPVAAVVAMVGLVAFGSRGAFLCLSAAVVLAAMLVLVQAIMKKRAGPAILAAIAGIGFYLLYRNFTALVSLLDTSLSSRGINSRTLQQLETGEIFDDNGRQTIYALVTNAIKQDPVFGYGVFGDRPIVGPSFIWGYSHNLFLEIFVSFGVLLGSLILLALLLGCIRYFVRASDRWQAPLLLLALSMSARLLVSDTFWGNPFFWMMLALLLVQREWSAASPPRMVGVGEEVSQLKGTI